MGLRMNDLHSPSVAASSSASASASQAAPASSAKPLLDLMSERDGIEEELKALGSVLASHNVDMDTPLLTADGFPRSDIDVAQIRTTRARIIWLRNDYKALTNKIEAGLHAHHAALRADASASAALEPASGTASGATAGISSSSAPRPDQPHPFAGGSASSLEPPFARVNSIIDGSPAHDAGMKAGDEIRRFGTANWTNHDRLAQVAQVVQRNEGRGILVRVKRKESSGGGGGGGSLELDLTLVPRRNWGGRGLLGCHLVPV